MFEKLLPYEAAHIILGDYFVYHTGYKRITKRAKIRFELCDWHGMQSDLMERVVLYRDMVGESAIKIKQCLGHKMQDRETWKAIKSMFLEEIFNFNSRNIAETYYNSVFRHSHGGSSVHDELMFVNATGSYREFKSRIPIYHTLYLMEPFEHSIRQLFACFPFDAPYENLERDIAYVSEILKRKLKNIHFYGQNSRIEILKPGFYRNKGCYLVGRIILNEQYRPFVIPLLHRKNSGIYADALLLDQADIRPIFSYNRTYFLVDTDIASEMVDFLSALIHGKSLGELYNSIGFEKHGKTVMYRDFLRNLEAAHDKFEHAPGIKGMVMIVFSQPSYPYVFKIIRDKFPAPKNVTEAEVKEKYALVSRHDRVGRMADSHMYENFAFDISRFSEALLEELLAEAPSKVSIVGNQVVIKHMYVEKRMIPLNIFLENASPAEAELVIDEYGKAIKQMAAVNIFPGDMLLKNFGVTTYKKVVFYDYDEIGFLTDYNFRRIPTARHYDDDMSSEPWYSVGPMDVFPEEFPRFLIGKPEIRNIFLRLHGDLFEPEFWIETQKRLRAGELVDVFPYPEELRFINIFGIQKEQNDVE